MKNEKISKRMMKKCLSVVLCFMMLIGTLFVQSGAQAVSELVHSIEQVSEAPQGYIGIRTPQELDKVRESLCANYILLSDIDLAPYENWEPIGTKNAPFTGVFNGNGHTVRNLQIHKANTDSVCLGLFGAVYESGKVLNTILDAAEIQVSRTQEAYVGGLIGLGHAAANCVVSAGLIDVSESKTVFVGGVAGSASYVQDCRNEAEITVRDAQTVYAGGIAGFCRIVRCMNSGEIRIDKAESLMLGGICGIADEEYPLRSCGNTANLSACNVQEALVGGIVGISFGVESCYSTGNLSVSGAKEFVGGISGYVQFSRAAEQAAKILDTLKALLHPKSGVTPMPSADSSVPAAIRDCIYLYGTASCAAGNAAQGVGHIRNTRSVPEAEIKERSTYSGDGWETDWHFEENRLPSICADLPTVQETVILRYRDKQPSVQGSMIFDQIGAENQSCASADAYGNITSGRFPMYTAKSLGYGTHPAVLISMQDLYGTVHTCQVMIRYTFWQRCIQMLLFGWLWY